MLRKGAFGGLILVLSLRQLTLAKPRPQRARQSMLSVLTKNLKIEIVPTDFAANLLIFLFHKNQILIKCVSDRLYCSLSGNWERQLVSDTHGLNKLKSQY